MFKIEKRERRPDFKDFFYIIIFIFKSLFKVTLYLQRCLQRCLASKRCSASGLNCRYLNPYIKLKLIELAIQLNHEF